MIDYDPKTATEHRTRWAAAVARLWDFSNLKSMELPPGADRPGRRPEHVFDFHDGLRLIVSVDRYSNGKDYLHVSASAQPGSAVHRRIKGGESLVRFSDLVKARVRFLSGRDVSLAYVTYPGKGVPHFFDPPLEDLCL